MNTRRRLLMSQAVQSAPVTTDNYVAGDIAFYDNTDDKIVLVHNEDINTDIYPADRYTPIGVVVIPNSHDVYGDGSCGVMSLMEMNCNTPVTGSISYQKMYWGISGVDFEALPNLNKIAVGNTEDGIPTAQQSSALIPSDRFDGEQCLHDVDVYYSTNSYSYAPSPYLTNGSRNTGYYQTTSPSSTNNRLADFDGRSNTDAIIAYRGTKDYTSWRPTYNTEADYPAASCCDMFYTNGTQQGDWYLPATGELGYIMPPFNKINEAFTNIQNKYGFSVGITLSTNDRIWSSTENDASMAITIKTDNGLAIRTSKRLNCYARAFIRIKPDGTITSRTTTS